ncbi:StAR-related lipid transfer protein 7, mitochondrial [Geodia barretti]|uniref:StAR-related lipid transfer protein 7, mitochondrial n=1 Tax=Geodia barretti TaxID=519541 RepID=A0AA35W4R9_GEOBA|nr:StAR-related lipid transfer protein 7, mitochondrial [Geodia barretti]
MSLPSWFWRLTARSLRTEVQPVSRRCALFRNNRPVFVKALNPPRSVVTTTGSRTSGLWQLLRGLAAGLKKGNHPSGRLLFSGAIAFLWERERIPTDDAISCLKEYDNRVKSQLHMMLEESPVVSSTTAPCTSWQEMAPSTENTSRIKHQLNLLLQQHSEKHLSQLPLVGLQRMGRLSSASAMAGEAVHRVTLGAVGRLSEAMTKPLRSWDKVEREEFKEFCDSQEYELTDTAPVSEDAVSEEAVKAVTDAMCECYVEHSKRHMAELPLVGLQNPGSVYNFSRSVADLSRKLFVRDSNVHSAALFLAHLGISLWDMPSFSVFPPSLLGLQVDSASLVTEGFSNLSVRDALDSALKQAKELLSLCTSARVVLDTFDSMSNRKEDLESSSNGRAGADKGMSTSQESVLTHQADQVQSSRPFPECPNENRNQHTDTDIYLQQSGWERFAEAESCTVYRKPHQSGLFMYKVIGRFTDISVKEFLDVQVDHACRKEWDSYVQKLETVEVDPETGTEVVHWVMKFPVCQ